MEDLLRLLEGLLVDERLVQARGGLSRLVFGPPVWSVRWLFRALKKALKPVMALRRLRRLSRIFRRKPAPFTPTPDDLRQLSEHLAYEVQTTFDLAAALIPTSGEPHASMVVRNAVLEAFTIHLRQLVGFLWDERPAKQTEPAAYAADYFAPEEWAGIRPTRPPELDLEVSSKVGWGVAHLAYRRGQTTPEEREWPPIKLCTALEPAIRCFIDNVDRTQFDPAWFDLIRPRLDNFKLSYGVAPCPEA